MSEPRKLSLVKPTIDTPLHIDFTWWKQHDNDWHVFLKSCLCPDHQALFENTNMEIIIDWIDPETAEVQSVDGLQHILMTHCSKQADFISNNIGLVDSVFRVFLANGNTPLSSVELNRLINRSADTILRTLTSGRVYKGLRPLLG